MAEMSKEHRDNCGVEMLEQASPHTVEDGTTNAHAPRTARTSSRTTGMICRLIEGTHFRAWRADRVVTHIEVIEWLGADQFSCLVHVRAGHPYPKPARNVLTTKHLFNVGRSHERAVLDLLFEAE